MSSWKRWKRHNRSKPNENCWNQFVHSVNAIIHWRWSIDTSAEKMITSISNSVCYRQEDNSNYSKRKHYLWMSLGMNESVFMRITINKLNILVGQSACFTVLLRSGAISADYAGPFECWTRMSFCMQPCGDHGRKRR